MDVGQVALVPDLHLLLVHPVGALGHQALNVGLENGVHGLLLQHRVGAQGACVVAGVLDEAKQVIQGLVTREGAAAAAVLKLQVRSQHLPALVVATDEVVSRHAHVVKEYGALPAFHQQAHFLYVHTLGGNVYDKVPEVPVSRRIRVRHQRADHHLGVLVATDEDVGAIEDPVVTVAGGPALVVGNVRA